MRTRYWKSFPDGDGVRLESGSVGEYPTTVRYRTLPHTNWKMLPDGDGDRLESGSFPVREWGSIPPSSAKVCAVHEKRGDFLGTHALRAVVRIHR